MDPMTDGEDLLKEQAARIAELEAALDDAYAFVVVAVNQYRLDFELDRLHDTHADIADRIARLLGKERMPSDVLKKKGGVTWKKQSHAAIPPFALLKCIVTIMDDTQLK